MKLNREYYSLTEASELLGYKNGSILRVYIWKGLVKGEKFGRNWVVTGDEIRKRERRIKEYRAKQAKKMGLTR
jgi:hypothetical protein